MNREYKIGDWVIYINKEWSDWWEETNGVSLYGKLAKIVSIDTTDNQVPYILEFKKSIKHTVWCDQNEFKLAIDHLKFKKWIGK